MNKLSPILNAVDINILKDGQEILAPIFPGNQVKFSLNDFQEVPLNDTTDF
jgi:hypothetical protein